MNKLLSDVNLWMRRLYDYKLLDGYEVLQVELNYMGTLFEAQLKMKGPSRWNDRFTTGHRMATPEAALQKSFEDLRRKYGAPDSEQRIDVCDLTMESIDPSGECFILGKMDFWVPETVQSSSDACSCNVVIHVAVTGDGALCLTPEKIHYCGEHKSAKAVEELMSKIYNHPLDGNSSIVELHFSKMVVLEEFFVRGEIVDKHFKLNKKGAIGAKGKTLLEALENLLKNVEDEYKDVERYLIGAWDDVCDSYLFVKKFYDGDEEGPLWTRIRDEARRFNCLPSSFSIEFIERRKPAISGLSEVHAMLEKCECLHCRLGEGKCRT